MTQLLSILLLSIGLATTPVGDIAKINQLKKEAEKAYLSGNFQLAAEKYAYLMDSLQVNDDKLTMNLGHAYYQLGNKKQAQAQYKKLAFSKDPQLKSMAYQQLGVLSSDPQTLRQALSYFKEAIKTNPSNQDARYNYELVKRKLQDQQNQDQKDQKDKQGQEQKDNQDQKDQKDKQGQEQKDKQGQEQKDKQGQEQKDKQGQEQKDKQGQEQKDKQGQEQKDKQGQEQKDKQGQEQKDKQGQEQKDKQGQEQKDKQGQEQKDKQGQEQRDDASKGGKKKPSNAYQAQASKISEAKAKMILEALKNSEIQYIQQNRRKPTKRRDSSKPDW